MQGLKACADRGFTHAVQVDADGKHAIEDIPKLLALYRASSRCAHFRAARLR